MSPPDNPTSKDSGEKLQLQRSDTHGNFRSFSDATRKDEFISSLSLSYSIILSLLSDKYVFQDCQRHNSMALEFHVFMAEFAVIMKGMRIFSLLNGKTMLIIM